MNTIDDITTTEFEEFEVEVSGTATVAWTITVKVQAECSEDAESLVWNDEDRYVSYRAIERAIDDTRVEALSWEVDTVSA